MKAPVRRMYGMSPLTTPLLMMSALSSGRNRFAIAWIDSRISTSSERPAVLGQVGAEQVDHRWASSSGWVGALAAARSMNRSRALRRARMPRRKPSSSSSVRSLRRVASFCASIGGHADEELVAARRELDPDHAPVVDIAAALDEAALLHAVHDPGRGRLRDAERLRERAASGWSPRPGGRSSRGGG